MLRISISQSAAGTVELVLEGRLAGPWVDELQAAVLATGMNPARIHLNLSCLQYADAAGIALLQRLATRGHHLEGPSPFMRELLAFRV
ncbi:MAG: hypothetical protein ACU843_14445 [Gammaproteobacteria bacterium]